MKVYLKEKNSSLWNIGTVSTTILAIIMFILFWNTSDVLWAGIFRFISFIGFAVAVINSLKAMDGNKKIELHSHDRQIDIKYLKKGKILLLESHYPEDIKKIYYQQQENYWKYLNGYTYFIHYRDSTSETCLFQFAGRCLGFNKESVQLLDPFFDEYDIPVCRNSKSSN